MKETLPFQNIWLSVCLFANPQQHQQNGRSLSKDSISPPLTNGSSGSSNGSSSSQQSLQLNLSITSTQQHHHKNSPKKNSNYPKKAPNYKQEIKMDSNGALNLATSTSSSNPGGICMVASADTSKSPPRTPVGPNGAASAQAGALGVESCVVCGDRASGNSSF